jgi:hypothetical protein
VLLRSYYSQSGESTLSFMNELDEIYVWGRFVIPANGSSKTQETIWQTPEKLNFLFDKSLNMKIKNY